ncbi:DUF3182 family protein [Lysobacter sp. GX 14042]|uniref:DUF3182 family protein n=1 Tax=Lysobacter sp. GX 14042 TaxID=2907155 RepID=UPI001F23B6B2|nr:DUF3182 family protein [Lysobacter sp. GX 14042]MCE7033121.1 DUF3182 family protein [Lysobacter sp. GX 14042]
MAALAQDLKRRGGDLPARRVRAWGGPRMRRGGHEHGTLLALARRLAELNGWAWGGESPGGEAGLRPYLVPQCTLEREEARAAGVEHPDDLFGGVVPHAFVGTKLVSHPAVGRHAAVPGGWVHGLGAALEGTVLPGFSVFGADEAHAAFQQLVPLGPVRLKLARGIGGDGQWVVHDAATLERVLGALPAGELAAHGASLEQNLEQATTYSIGTAECGRHAIAYTGVQRTTRRHDGAEAYGGSTLEVVRGGFDALGVAGLPAELAPILDQVRRYDARMDEAFEGFHASRRNYDVVAGVDAAGRPCSGVLEQSWRIGGASPAEILAMEHFAADRSLQRIRVSCHESYGGRPPPGAVVHYDEEDPRVGRLVKYAMVEGNGHAS